MLLLYSSSTLYHGIAEPNRKSKVRFFDHISIYFLIAGSYTPFLLISVGGKLGWWFFGIIWLVALVGVVYKLFWWKKYPKISLYLYLGMGWVVLFIVKPLFQSLSLESIIGLILGGIFYSAGTIFYSMKTKAYSHVIWHIFVLMGSASHFFAVADML
jgi:hemolysin III